MDWEALQHRIALASALKRFVVRRCLDQISVAEFDVACAEIADRWFDTGGFDKHEHDSSGEVVLHRK